MPNGLVMACHGGYLNLVVHEADIVRSSSLVRFSTCSSGRVGPSSKVIHFLFGKVNRHSRSVPQSQTGAMASASTSLVLFFSYLLLVTAVCDAHGRDDASSEPSESFYSKSCPRAAKIVKRMVKEFLRDDKNLAGGFQRLQFHDCWVNGCEASLLLNSTATNTAERDGFTNFKIRAIPEIDQIKAALEEACPSTVSCADILALVARDATVHVGGPSWPVVLGRRDGVVSRAVDADNNLPFPSLDFDDLVDNFARKGFNSREMIILSGAHTIGRTHCNGVAPNLYNFSGIEDLTNPSLDPKFAQHLKRKCPKGNTENIVNMDPTKNKFDRRYFKKVLANKGVFISDTALITDSFGLEVVEEVAKKGSSFFDEFAAAMVKMGKLGLLTGNEGEIRKHCQFIN